MTDQMLDGFEEADGCAIITELDGVEAKKASQELQ